MICNMYSYSDISVSVIAGNPAPSETNDGIAVHLLSTDQCPILAVINGR